jgi:nitrite reductase (NADH) large subunit
LERAKKKMKYLIIGNGVAGIEAALSIRKSDPQGEITVISESKNLFYYRPKLIDCLAGEVSLDQFTIYNKEFYEKNNITNVLGTKITKIIPGKNIIISENGTEYGYDKLLLATGANCFVPPIRGVNKKGVFVLREVEDVDGIREYCQDIENIVVMGGGFLGLEAAYSLTKLGKRVTVIEVFDMLLPRQLDKEAAALLRKLLEEKGLSFVLPDLVLAIEGENPAGSVGKVQNVILKSGKQVKAGAVVICTGIRGRDRLAREAKIKVEKGIVINDYMQTSIENVYCAGDPAQHHGKLYGLWAAAKEQGKIAGLNMAGIPTKYAGTLSSGTLKITGIVVYSAGDFDAVDAQIFVSKEKNIYRKLLLKNNRPVGAIVVGDSESAKTASRVFEGKAPPEEFKKYF